MKKIIALFVIFACSHSIVFAQYDLKIKVLNSASRQPLAKTIFTLSQNEQVVLTDSTNQQGDAVIKNLSAGKYAFKINET